MCRVRGFQVDMPQDLRAKIIIRVVKWNIKEKSKYKVKQMWKSLGKRMNNGLFFA